MDKEEVISAAKSVYQKGYREGFTDACGLMRDATTGLVVSMEESLDSKTVVVDEQEELEND